MEQHRGEHMLISPLPILAVEHRLFDRKRAVYHHSVTGDDISIGDAVKRGFVQVSAVSSQITEQRSDFSSSGGDGRSKLSIRIESQPSSGRPTGQVLRSEKDIVEIESFQRVPRHRRHHHTTTEEEIVEQHTTNIIDKEVYINRGRSSERPRQRHIEEVIIDDGSSRNRRDKVDIKEERQTIHREIVIEGDRHRPPPPREQLVINGSYREHEVRWLTT